MESNTLSLTSGVQTIESIQNILIENTINNLLLQTETNLVDAIPNIDLRSIQFPENDKHVTNDILAHQISARIAAESFYATSSSPLSILTNDLSETTGFVNQWNAYYSKMMSLTNTILSSEEDRSNLILGIQSLRNSCNVKEKNCLNSILSLTNFQTSISNALLYLNGDKTIISKIFSGESGIISQLEKEIVDLNTTMENDNKTNAKGAIKQGLGVLIITVVVVAEIFANSDEEEPEMSEESGKIIEASIDIIKEDQKLQTAATAEWNASFVKYQNTVKELASDKQLYSAVLQLCNTMTLINKNISDAIYNEKLIQTNWSNLDSSFENLQDQIKNADSSEIQIIKEEFTQLNNSLNELRETAISLESVGTISVKN